MFVLHTDTDMFFFVGRYEWFQLFAHQLLWIIDVCGLWQISSWERTARGVGEQSWVSPCIHGAGTEAKQPPQLTHAHTKTLPHANTCFLIIELFQEYGATYVDFRGSSLMLVHCLYLNIDALRQKKKKYYSILNYSVKMRIVNMIM